MCPKCQHSGPAGMCHYDALDGSDYCRRHGDEPARIRGYQLTDPELRSTFEQMSASTELRSLKEDVALLRALLVSRVNYARNEAEKIQAIQNVAPMFATVDKLVNSLDKLERRTGEVLEKAAATKLVGDILNILMDELNGVENRDTIVDRVAKRIAQVIAEARNVEE